MIELIYKLFLHASSEQGQIIRPFSFGGVEA